MIGLELWADLQKNSFEYEIFTLVAFHVLLKIITIMQNSKLVMESTMNMSLLLIVIKNASY